ncbi:FecR family protein [Arcticibacter svalbardensis]|nr:FecR domain-containing protein [Arcticibacter svalbardensis]
MNKDLLKKYFEGKASLTEKQQVYQYFKGEDMTLFDEYINDQESDPSIFPIDPEYKEEFYQKIRRLIPKKAPSKQVITRITPILKLAASVLLISGIGSLIWLGARAPNNAQKQFLLKAFYNNSSVMRKMTLSDGTFVWLNPGTTITYNKTNYADTSREVQLSGEAFFDVAHDSAKPFRVHTGNLTTTVRGTAFNVEAYQRENTMRIILVRGNVEIQAGNTNSKLTAGQMLLFDQSKKHSFISPIDVTKKEALFTTGKITFVDVPLKDVMDRMEIAFNIKIICSSKRMLMDKTITGSYERKNAEETLKRILFIHGLKYHKKGNNTYLVYD